MKRSIIAIMVIGVLLATFAFVGRSIEGEVTDVQGNPEIEIVFEDVKSPVAVGETSTYIVHVINHGSVPAKDVEVVCKIEDSIEYLSSGGAASGTLNGKEILFPALKTLDAGKSAQFEIAVKAVKEDDAFFTTEVQYEQMDYLVSNIESANIYR